ncbi:hypothetical protein EVAR_101817_1 [Eumeta japonica]|uniref:Uncharacterized protein n=1 Tax=Eumeta variegata TaxID=151549 RepID=A0A4C1SQF6_EUMVA|nr:hypothetical protein EVAR_101817_1 [Eumeta japonica]
MGSCAALAKAGVRTAGGDGVVTVRGDSIARARGSDGGASGSDGLTTDSVAKTNSGRKDAWKLCSFYTFAFLSDSPIQSSVLLQCDIEVQ